MKRFLLSGILFCIGLVCLAQQPRAQFNGCPAGFCSGKTSAVTYVGPGNVVTGALAFSALRAYNGAYAASLGKLANVCTPLDAACADVSSNASGNFNLAGAGSLTCNNAGSICTIKTLYDQSGGTNCSAAACDLTNATIANRPILVVAGAANGCPSISLPCMSFNGTSQRLVSAGSISISQPYTFASMTNNANNGATASVFGTGNAGVLFNVFGANEADNYCGSVNNTTASDNSWHALQGICNGASSDMNVDGVANTGAGGASPLNTPVEMGTVGGASFFKGKTFEGGIWGLAFSGTQSSNMSSNQHAYGGF